MRYPTFRLILTTVALLGALPVSSLMAQASVAAPSLRLASDRSRLEAGDRGGLFEPKGSQGLEMRRWSDSLRAGDRKRVAETRGSANLEVKPRSGSEVARLLGTGNPRGGQFKAKDIVNLDSRRKSDDPGFRVAGAIA